MEEQGRCKFLLGKVMERQCPKQASCRCIKCSRDMCPEHSMPTTAGIMCVECVSQKPFQPLHSDTLYSDEEMALFDKKFSLWAPGATSLYETLGIREDEFDAS